MSKMVLKTIKIIFSAAGFYPAAENIIDRIDFLQIDLTTGFTSVEASSLKKDLTARKKFVVKLRFHFVNDLILCL